MSQIDWPVTKSFFESRRGKLMFPMQCTCADTVTTRPGPLLCIRSKRRFVSRKWPKWFTPNAMPKPLSVRPGPSTPETFKLESLRVLEMYNKYYFMIL